MAVGTKDLGSLPNGAQSAQRAQPTTNRALVGIGHRMHNDPSQLPADVGWIDVRARMRTEATS